ncbi:MAG: alpha/beta hydrolase domain-containing protein [Pseudomonadota bacterium]
MTRNNKRILRWLKCYLLLGVLLFGAITIHPGFASATADSPMVSGPLTDGAPFLWATSFDLADIGYQQAEFLISGTANAYVPLPGEPFGVDGKWTVAPNANASYTTRAIVYRPIDPKMFNGTVIVEWFNVSSGLDSAPDWTTTHNELARSGYIWVGISAQEIGLNSTKAFGGPRYEDLSHPGDSFSYDIFSQAGQAIWDNAATMFDGLTPTVVIAAGESQSAFRLVTYINAVHPIVDVYNGFLVHSRWHFGAPLYQDSTPAPVPNPGDVPSPTQIRDDLNVPVLVFMTETDVAVSGFSVTQPDTDIYRLWEVAGTAHADLYSVLNGSSDIGDGQDAVMDLESMQNPPSIVLPGLMECDYPVNTGPQHWVLQAAVHALNKWVTKGIVPPVAPRFETNGFMFEFDQHGNVRGGIRTPQVDVPIAALSGLGNTGIPPEGSFCGLFGTTIPFTSEKMAELYPNHGRFVWQWAKATHKAVKKGFILPKDGRELMKAAAMSEIGKKPRCKKH